MSLFKKILIFLFIFSLIVLALNNDINIDVWDDNYPVLLKPELLRSFVIFGLYAITYITISAIDRIFNLFNWEDDKYGKDIEKVFYKYFISLLITLAIWNFVFSFFFTF